MQLLNLDNFVKDWVSTVNEIAMGASVSVPGPTDQERSSSAERCLSKGRDRVWAFRAGRIRFSRFAAHIYHEYAESGGCRIRDHGDHGSQHAGNV